MDFDDADALDRAVATKLGYENQYNVSSVPRKALLSVDVYQVNTANGQPITHAKTRGGNSKGGDGGASRASGTRSNNGNGYGGRDNTNMQPLTDGGVQGNGRDDEDRDNDNNDKKKALSSHDANIPDSSSDDENDNRKNLKTKRKTRNKANEPSTPSPKGKRIKNGGKSFKQTNNTRPADYRTPSAPPISPLYVRNRRPQIPQTPPNRNSRPEYVSPLNNGPAPSPGEEIDQENRRMIIHGPRPSRNPPHDRPPLAQLPLSPSRIKQDKTPVPSSPSRPTNPNPPILTTHHPPRNPDIVDMGIQPPNPEPPNPRRASIDNARRQNMRTLRITNQGSPVRLQGPPIAIANPDLITYGPYPGFRTTTSGSGRGARVGIYDPHPVSPLSPSGGEDVGALVAVMVAPDVRAEGVRGSNLLAPCPPAPQIRALAIPALANPAPPNPALAVPALANPAPPNPPPLQPNATLQPQPAARQRGGRRGRARGRERDARGRFVRAGEGSVRAAGARKAMRGTGTGRGNGNGRRGRGGGTGGRTGGGTGGGTGGSGRGGVGSGAAPTRRSARLKKGIGRSS